MARPFSFIATNAYWLPFLNSDQDIDATLANMSATGISVVRTWAFNDVTSVPQSGSFLQVIANGTTTINTGPNGLQRLDTVVKLAAKHNIYVIFVLTNNWGPTDVPTSPARRWATTLPRNFLSNNYGGIDSYIQEFGIAKTHDEFYSSNTIKGFFKNYTTAVISRFVNNSAILAWELANDPRCSSTVSTSSSCVTTVVTQWHAELAKHDPRLLMPHMSQNVHKVNPSRQAQPQPSGSAHKRTTGGRLTSKLRRMITNGRRAASRAPDSRDTVNIRGRWTAPSEAKRWNTVPGPAFDGSFGVDTEDILNIPEIDFSSFQLFPDQNNYSPTNTPFLSPSASFEDAVQLGIEWIQAQGDIGLSIRKPVVLTAFGLLTHNNVDNFVQFNGTTPVVPPNRKRKGSFPAGQAGTVGMGLTDDERNVAYQAWLTQIARSTGISGMGQYQWSSQGLQAQSGTVVQGSTAGGTQGYSPNDGYGIQGTGQTAAQQTLKTAKQGIS
ncbi:glycoside hydrolase superfamily [Lactifluus volemus]|nr:glycoside hydrolase superfamily [Lactifluus volemus]